MELLRWLPVTGLVLIALEQLVHRGHYERVRALRRRWRETNRTLSAADRREVHRAVGSGVAVKDPWLAEAAIEMAEVVSVGRPRGSLRWVGDSVFAVWILAPVIVAGTRQDWVWMVGLALVPLSLVTLAVFGRRFQRRAEAALLANRRIPPPPRHSDVDAEYVPLPGVGLPRSVARARRLVEPRPAPSASDPSSTWTPGRDR